MHSRFEVCAKHSDNTKRRELIESQEDEKVQKELKKLFVENDEEVQMKSLGALRQILTEKPFAFDFCVQKIDGLILDYAQDLFEVPVFNNLYFPDESQASSDGLAVQQGGRNSTERGSLPRQTTQKRKRASIGRKETTRRDMDEEGEEYLPEDEQDEDYLPSSKRRKSQRKSYKGRRVWTDEEKTAIKEGIKVQGKGKWADIKEAYAEILKDRTSQQIKVSHYIDSPNFVCRAEHRHFTNVVIHLFCLNQDCFRTMKKRGELKGIIDEDEE